MLLEPQAAYELWAATYPPEPHNALMALEQQTLLSLLPDLRGRTVLDAGCGTGRYLRLLRSRGAKAIGIDLSSAMLSRARADQARVARANVCALPLGAMSVDVVVSGLALGDVPHLDAAIAEMARVIRPGGCLLYSVVHPLGGPAGWSRTFTVSGRQNAVATCWHSLDEHRRACALARLDITGWEEPVLAVAAEHPAVLVVRASR